jgi:hypothetical protein
LAQYDTQPGCEGCEIADVPHVAAAEHARFRAELGGQREASDIGKTGHEHLLTGW